MTSLSTLPGMPLVATAAHLDAPAVVGATRPWTWRQIHVASIELAQRLEGASAVCNLCDSRLGFLVTWLAALRRRCLLVLPPSSAQADLAAVLDASARPVVVADDADAIPSAWRDHARCLAWRPEWRAAHATAAELAWQPAWDETAVLLHTSGSTGAPVAQPRLLRHLVHGALVLATRLDHEITGGLRSVGRIVCSVPPQHMFGLESSVMLPLVHGIAVQEGRPLLPADVLDAFAAPPPGVWVATPLHLRSLVRAGGRLANCRAVIASTMALPEPLARQAEALAGAPVLEIYGSTETGAMALRRTAHDARWRPLRDVTVEAVAGTAGTQVRGAHFASPVTLLDEVEIDSGGCFTLLGRQADLIKIGGRRASIAGLNALLQELPGLEDGVFYLPTAGEPTARLSLIHSGPVLDRAATQRWLRARIDPVFLPRTLIRVDRLPRDASGKLPRHALDRIYAHWQASAPVTASAPATIDFEVTVPADHPALPGHFPGHPVVPGVLLLDQVFTRLSAVLGRPVETVQQVKFIAPLAPGETARVSATAEGQRISFSVTTQRDGVALRLASGSVLLATPRPPP